MRLADTLSPDETGTLALMVALRTGTQAMPRERAWRALSEALVGMLDVPGAASVAFLADRANAHGLPLTPAQALDVVLGLEFDAEERAAEAGRQVQHLALLNRNRAASVPTGRHVRIAQGARAEFARWTEIPRSAS